MSDAKWHPASGEFGVFGDYGPGNEGSRSDRAARDAAGAIEEQYNLFSGIEQGFNEYYDLLESISGEQQDISERQSDIDRQELINRFAGSQIMREGMDLQRDSLSTSRTSMLDDFLDQSRTLQTRGDAMNRAGRGLISGEAAQSQAYARSGLTRTTEDALGSIRERLATLGLEEDKIDLMEDNFTLQGQSLTQSDRLRDLTNEQNMAQIGKQRIDELTNLENTLFQLETLGMDYGGIDTSTGSSSNYQMTDNTTGPGRVTQNTLDENRDTFFNRYRRT